MRRYSARRLSQRSKKVLPWRNGNAGDLQRERQNECGSVIVQTGKINPQDIPLGSYILVSGFDDSKPHVAQLLSLNDDGSTASVCWFARPSELPKRLLDKIHRPLHSQELFLCMEGERRRSLWSSKIDTDTILGPAQVKLLKADDPDPAADLDNVFVVHLSWDGRTVSPLTAEQLSSQQLDPQAVVTTPSAEPSVPRNGTNGMNQRRSAKDCKSQVHVCRLTTEEIISLIFEEESTVTNESSKRGKVSSGHSTKTATRSPSVRKCNDRRDEPLPSPHTLKIRRTTRENTKNVSIAQDCKTPIHKNDSPWCLRSASRLLAKSNGTAKTQSTVSDTSKRKKILEESDYEDIAETDEDSEEEEENEIDDDDDEEEEPEAERPKRSHRHVPRRRVSQGKGRTISSPSMPCRSRPAVSSPGVLEDARGRLCVSAVPDSLPCREEEFHHLYSFISSKLDDGTGGCMYVSGVPGTGKTATLCEVVRVLREGVCQGCVPEFRFVELNGLRLTEPRHAFSHVLKVLTGRKATPDHAASLLDEMFSQCGTHHEATLLLVDEVDSLCSRPAVIYRLLDWPSHRGSRLILVAIANTLDLPERLQGRLASRLGVTRLAFPPYSHKQLVQVLGARLEGLQAFQPDALALVARKVAALSGDARRALDICRRAAEIALNTSPRRQQRVEMAHMSRALDEMFSSPCILAVRQASWLQRAFLQALLAEFSHSGVEEATLLEVYPRLVSLCRLEGIAPPSMSRTYASCAALYACRLVLADTACKPWRLRLSGSRDDITFALRGAEGLKS